MPYKKTYSKKKYPKKARLPRSNLMGHVSGMPLTRTTRMRYVTPVEIASTGGVINYHSYRCNSVYDPDATTVITDHQPMGFDQWTQLYNHYIVKGSKINVQLTKSTGDDRMAVGIYISDDASVPYTDFTGFAEAQKGTYKLNAYQRNSLSINTSFSTKGYFNVADLRDNFKRLGALVSDNPSEQAYYMLWLQGMDTGNVNIQAIVTIDYIVEFSEPKDLTQS